MDITPEIPQDRQVIEGYGEGRFRISGQDHQGSVLVFPDRTLAWPVATMSALTMESLAPVLAAEPEVEILLIGCGARHELLPSALRQALRDNGIACDSMATGAGCRTYNILLADSRRVAAALIAI